MPEPESYSEGGSVQLFICLLIRYKSFIPAEEGWRDAVLDETLRALRRGRSSIPVKEKAGCLAFDEMSVTRGLVWSRGTGKLYGWTSTDLAATRARLGALLPEEEQEDIESSMESKLASHLLQVITCMACAGAFQFYTCMHRRCQKILICQI